MENARKELRSGEEGKTMQERKEKGGESEAVQDDMKRVGDDAVARWKKRVRA